MCFLKKIDNLERQLNCFKKELNELKQNSTNDQTFAEVPFDPTGTGLTATTVQGAIAEILANATKVLARGQYTTVGNTTTHVIPHTAGIAPALEQILIFTTNNLFNASVVSATATDFTVELSTDDNGEVITWTILE